MYVCTPSKLEGNGPIDQHATEFEGSCKALMIMRTRLPLDAGGQPVSERERELFQLSRGGAAGGQRVSPR